MPTQMVVANGIQQCYEVAGGRGPWVTLVHGAGDNHEAWGFQVPELVKRFRVLTYDVRGHGETETPDSPIAPETLVEDLRGLLDALRVRRTAVLGYSMGAGIVRNFAATYPARVWAAVLSNGGRLDTPPDPAREVEMARMREERVAAIRKGGMGANFDGVLNNVYTPEFAAARPDIIAWHRNVARKNAPEKYLKVMGRGFGVAPQVDLGRISAPTLIVVGAGDPYTAPAQAQELARAIRGAQVSVFPTRHGSPFERAEEFNRTVVAFLEASRPRRGR
ncbi:MAG: alpha/beta fold hydrolase [Chloroflexi bacterium]|nr:alpha/beta fold hydrolase [Chloroflexota bacterium]